jgi:hypothetical protein
VGRSIQAKYSVIGLERAGDDFGISVMIGNILNLEPNITNYLFGLVGPYSSGGDFEARHLAPFVHLNLLIIAAARNVKECQIL